MALLTVDLAAFFEERVGSAAIPTSTSSKQSEERGEKGGEEKRGAREGEENRGREKEKKKVRETEKEK